MLSGLLLKGARYNGDIPVAEQIMLIRERMSGNRGERRHLSARPSLPFVRPRPSLKSFLLTYV